MAHSKFKYSEAIYAYVPKPMKKDMDQIRKRDPRRFSHSQIVEDALASYLPGLKQRMGLVFSEPTHEAQSRKTRKGSAAA